MKKAFLLMNILGILNLPALTAQTSQGKLIVGVSTSFSFAGLSTLTGSSSNLLSLGYSTTKYKSDASGYKVSDPEKVMNINLAPKVGYFVVDNLAVGLDINAGVSSLKISDVGSKNSTTLIGAGPFVRYYVPTAKVLPFFELGGCFGVLITKNKYSFSPVHVSTTSVMSFGGGAGIAAPLGDKVTFDVMLGYNSLTVKSKENNDDNERSVMGTFGLRFGFIVLLGAN